MNLENPFAVGNTAEIYLQDNKIIKVFKDYLPETEALYEAKKQEFAYSCGLHVPKIDEVTKINGRPAIIMEYVQGTTIGELLLNNIERAEEYLKICVEVQLEIHSKVGDANLLESMDVKLKRQIGSSGNLDPDQKKKLLNQLESLDYEPRLCHGDFHPFNLIKSDQHITIIDWVDASLGDPCADVYRTYLLILETSEELAEMYLHQYVVKSGRKRHDFMKWEAIIAGARLTE